MKDNQEAFNERAFIVGLLTGLFGLWGIAHLINKRLAAGLLAMFVFMPVYAITSVALGLVAGAVAVGLLSGAPIALITENFEFWRVRAAGSLFVGGTVVWLTVGSLWVVGTYSIVKWGSTRKA